MATKSAIIARIALNLVGVGTIRAVHAPAASGAVLAIPEQLSTVPAAMLLAGDSPVIPGQWERQTWMINGSVWMGDKPRGERVTELTDLGELVLAAFRQPDVTAVDEAVQSVVLTEVGAITSQQWTRGDTAPWFLVLPFTLEVKVNRSVTYGPA